MNKPTQAPPPYEYSLGHPNGLAAVDMDIIKLTAQYTAANGRDFLSTLAQKEQRNPQFDFLKPTHLLFSYFTSLVDAYAKILHPVSDTMSRIQAKCERMKALELAVSRWEWTRAEEERKKRESAEADAERIAYQSIDWFDFVVVETIEFPEDELFEFEAMSIPLAQQQKQQQQALNSDAATKPVLIPQGGRAPPPPSFTPFQQNGSSRPPNTAHHSAPPPPPSSRVVVDDDDDMDMDMDDDDAPARPSQQPQFHHAMDQAMDDDEDEGDLKVVSHYAPRLASAGTAKGAMTMIDPISGRVLPVEEMSEHMRVQLLDPRCVVGSFTRYLFILCGYLLSHSVRLRFFCPKFALNNTAVEAQLRSAC